MWIKVGEEQYELSTKLGVGRKIEDRFKIPIGQLFGKLTEAQSSELVDIVCIAAGKDDNRKPEDQTFKKAIYEEWDFSDLYGAVQELVVRLMFSGTPEQNETKLERFPVTEAQKNAIRRLLGMPLSTPEMTSDPSDSTGNGS